MNNTAPALLEVHPWGETVDNPTTFSLLLPILCRELLTDHRVPGLLLEAMKVAIRKQRKKIKAKMLGTPEEAESRYVPAFILTESALPPLFF